LITNSQKEDRIGETFIISEVVLYSLFPIIINYSTKVIPPILFAGLSIITASIFLFFYILFKRGFKTIFNKKAFKYILGVTIFIIIIPSILIYEGTKLTSGVNTAILLQSEALFALFLCSIFFKEKITKEKIISAILIIFGATIVLYNGVLSLNLGDLLIVIGASLYPIGNIFAKKALKLSSPAVITFLRSLIGGIILIIISLIFEKSGNIISINSAKKFLWLILLNGIVIMAISKILWYEGLKRLDIGKATTLSMIYPAFSLIFAALFLDEIPTIYQLFGMLIISIGAYLITHKKSLNKPQISPI